LGKAPPLVKRHYPLTWNVADAATTSDQLPVAQLINRLPPFKGVIDFLSDTARDLAFDPAEHDGVDGVHQAQTEPHRVEPFFGMVLIGARVDDHPATKLALDVS